MDTGEEWPERKGGKGCLVMSEQLFIELAMVARRDKRATPVLVTIAMDLLDLDCAFWVGR